MYLYKKRPKGNLLRKKSETQPSFFFNAFMAGDTTELRRTSQCNDVPSDLKTFK